jgi:hypothetical protein
VQNIDVETLLVVVFRAHVSVGAVKYFANVAVPQIARQFIAAHERNPDSAIDLSMMNLEDSSEFFRKVARTA